MLDKSASAQIIDRCASCVGVGHALGDPTTPDNLANGATVDLSRDLWNHLSDGAAGDVFDVEYDGDALLGWDEPPTPLGESSTLQCS